MLSVVPELSADVPELVVSELVELSSSSVVSPVLVLVLGVDVPFVSVLLVLLLDVLVALSLVVAESFVASSPFEDDSDELLSLLLVLEFFLLLLLLLTLTEKSQLLLSL